MKDTRGFTLIELLVVIAIIGLLSSVVLASLNGARVKARDAKRKSDLHQIQLALELYRDTAGAYPPLSTSQVVPDLNTLAPTYISSVPLDPLNSTSRSGAAGYRYYTGQTGNVYTLMAILEGTAGWCYIRQESMMRTGHSHSLVVNNPIV